MPQRPSARILAMSSMAGAVLLTSACMPINTAAPKKAAPVAIYPLTSPVDLKSVNPDNADEACQLIFGNPNHLAAQLAPSKAPAHRTERVRNEQISVRSASRQTPSYPKAKITQTTHPALSCGVRIGTANTKRELTVTVEATGAEPAPAGLAELAIPLGSYTFRVVQQGSTPNQPAQPLSGAQMKASYAVASTALENLQA